MLSNQEKRRINNSCQTCRASIYEGELFYVSSKGRDSGYDGGAYGGKSFSDYQTEVHGKNHSSAYVSESWIQCARCYDQWQIELAANRKFWIKWWLGGVLLIIIATIFSVIAFPGLERFYGNSVVWYRLKIFSLGSWEIPLLSLITFTISLLLVKIAGSWFQPTVDRYKLRKRPIKL